MYFRQYIRASGSWFAGREIAHLGTARFRCCGLPFLVSSFAEPAQCHFPG